MDKWYRLCRHNGREVDRYVTGVPQTLYILAAITRGPMDGGKITSPMALALVARGHGEGFEDPEISLPAALKRK